MTSPKSDEVHHRVARLSITVEDENLKNERSKFLNNLADNSQLKRSDSSAILDDESTDKITTSNSLFNLGALNSVTKKDSKKKKRRRSSVQQGTALRKKKFLLQNPTFSIKDDIKKKVTISSLRDLIMYSLTDVNSIPRWCQLDNRKSVERVVVVFIRGLTEPDFGLLSFKDKIEPAKLIASKVNKHLNVFPEIFDEVLPLQSPGSKKCIFSTYTSLVSYSLSPKERAQIQRDNEEKKITINDLYLTLDQLLCYGYPIHSSVKGATKEMINKTSDYVSTVEFEHSGSKTFALDCEMCRSRNGKVLARVSLTNFDNEVLIDKFVKPSEEITDYLTQWSGITEEKLNGVETTLQDVQNEILSIVSSSDTLVGHSLESDLEVLKLKHPRIIDTSVCFDHPRGPPAKPSLKSLMLLHLQKDVQMGLTGHDSIEDCISCMDLLKMKIEKGYLYGKSYNTESLYSRLAKTNKLILNTHGEKVPKSSMVIDYSAPKAFGQGIETRYQAHSDDEVIKLFEEHQSEHDLIIFKLRELEWFKKLAGDSKPDSVVLPATEDEMYDKVNKMLRQIYQELTPNSILAISTENGDTREMIRLQNICREFKAKYENGSICSEKPTPEEDWTEAKADLLTDAINEARNTLFFCTLKTSD